MKNLVKIFVLIVILFPSVLYSQNGYVVEYPMDIYDSSRERSIPLAIYSSDDVSKGIVIMNHGYGKNEAGSYKTYSVITKYLASQGFFVISIQHELPTDDLLAMDGNLYETRMPNWQKGVDNILFTVQELKDIRSDLDWNNVNLIGHSNGGDMAMLFATQYPGLIKRSISLDHRRMPMPLTEKVKLYTLRGCDYEADEGVLPSDKNREKYSIEIIKFEDIKHGDMDDKGTEEQLQRINGYLLKFLTD